MNVFDLRRLKGLAAALAAITVVLVIFSALARGWAKSVSRVMTDGDSTMEGGQDSVVGKRLAGVVWEKRHKGVPGDLDMAVILGPSGVSKDFAPTLLEAAAGPQIPQRWLCLAGNGANTTDLRGLADLLTASRLHVKLLVLAIHPALLARSDDYLSDSTNFDTRAFFAEMEGGNFTTAKLELAALLQVSLNRLYPERTRIGHHSRVIAAEVKRRLFTALGMGVDALFAPDPDPWAVNLPVEDNNWDQDAEWRRQVNFRDIQEGPMFEGRLGQVKDKGWNNLASYTADGANARNLVEMIRESRSHGSEVVLLLLPERSDFRSDMPVAAMNCLRETLHRGFPVNPPLVIDLRDKIEDDYFHDPVHIKEEWRSATTLKLVEALLRRSDRHADSPL
jgi:hypothetical protein